MQRTAEEALRIIAEKAAVLGSLGQSAGTAGDFEGTQRVMFGITEICDDIERMAEAVRSRLPPDALDTDIKW